MGYCSKGSKEYKELLRKYDEEIRPLFEKVIDRAWVKEWKREWRKVTDQIRGYESIWK